MSNELMDTAYCLPALNVVSGDLDAPDICWSTLSASIRVLVFLESIHQTVAPNM